MHARSPPIRDLIQGLSGQEREREREGGQPGGLSEAAVTVRDVQTLAPLYLRSMLRAAINLTCNTN